MEAQKASDEVETVKALIENDGIDMAAVHKPDENDTPMCGATVAMNSPVNLEAGEVGDHWCEDCE